MNHPATEEYVDLIFEIFDEPRHPASVLKTLPVGKLVQEILKEFEGLDATRPDRYALHLAENEVYLEPGKTLAEQGVQPGDRLVFGWAQKPRASARLPVTQPGQAFLQEQATGTSFPISWQPARIGRPDEDPLHNELLAANLEWLTNGRRVSRRQAEIIEQDGNYNLRGLTAQNPTLLNGRPVLPGQLNVLRPNDRITMGQSGIVLDFILKGK